MKKTIWVAAIILLLVFFFLRLKNASPPRLEPGTKIKITAVLRQEPKIVGQSQRFSLMGIKISTWRYPEFHYGDKLVVLGTIKEGNEMAKIEEIKVIEKTRPLLGRLLDLRHRLEKSYRRLLPEPQASLLSGIVLGSKSGLPYDFYENLRQTGVLHVVVASGMNVTFVAATMIDFFLLFFSRRLAIWFAFLAIWFYVLLAGAEAPVVRAGIMGTLAFLAQGLGRQADAWRGLGLAAVVLLLINPLSLFDLGFQLSFLATGGILFFGTAISSWLKRLPRQIRSDLSQTLGAQVVTFPLLLLTFGYYSPLSPLVNLLVVPIIPWLMRLGGLIVILGLISLGVAQIFAWISLPFLTYFVYIVKLFS